MNITSCYKVAGHTFRLSFSSELFEGDSLDNYAAFRLSEDSPEYVFHLSVSEYLPEHCVYEHVGRFDNDVASIVVFKSKDGGYRFNIAPSEGSGDYCTLETDASFRTASAKLSHTPLRVFHLNNCLMLLYAFSTAKLDTVLMHASVIRNNGRGFMFSGKSGTGKSTHSRLWLEHIAGSELLNDDNPVVRIVDGKAWVFGSPWSGKTPCYRNESIPLKGIVKLRQAPENKIVSLLALQAYAALLPACSCMRWEDGLMAGVHSTIEKLALNVGCYVLDCLPDEAAAQLCVTTIGKTHR